jgi:ribosomal protein S17
MFEVAGIAHALRPQPGTDASVVVDASNKRKCDTYNKATGKRAKVAAKKKTAPPKVTLTLPKAKSDSKRPSDMELALAKPLKKTKNFSLASSS